MSADLIAKLEAATEGSRELSDAVLLAAGWTHVVTGDAREECWRDPKGKSHDYWNDPYVRGESAPHRPSPTESLDAALTLVKEDWTYNLAWDRRLAWAACGVPGTERLAVSAPTLPLALCIAALRARTTESAT